MDHSASAAQPTPIERLAYAPPAFWIDAVDLTFDLDPLKTRVLNTMKLRRNPDVQPQALRLDGQELNVARVLVNGSGTSFKLDGDQLVLENLPEGMAPFDLEIFTTCNPSKNTELMGLYVSDGDFFTQCEAQGFQRITYFLDRPDVMANYTVTLRADKAQYPVLLSNGNLVDHGDLDGGRHFAKWVDPHKKPCYLFALVAGRLVAREQRITTRSGTEHLLQVFVRPGDLDKTDHAMRSLMASVAWDEARFGLPLDLERFMIVATSDFNMGAMENKGLNIFNTKFVLATAATATDSDFANIESVVGHEYFHNWTGNRVTCRDWFQLSLKEGLTVFRDQEFSQDMAHTASARAALRIQDVRVLRSVQFAEDAGPMAHPVRPDSYIEINNFYTLTIYEKGSEVVRMMQTLVASADDPSGRAGFARGMALYFARHDGQAVTCDDFAQALADANPASELTQHLHAFKRWYAQAGTPVLRARGQYNPTEKSYTLHLSQSCPPTPGQAQKLPNVIPITLGLLGPDGQALPLQWVGSADAPLQRTLVLTQAQASVTFVGIDCVPVPSLLRGFSAPVLLDDDLDSAALLHLLAHDSDPFNQCDAGQRLLLQSALAALTHTAPTDGATPLLTPELLQALRQVLRHPTLDAAFKELVLSVPAEGYIADHLHSADPQRIHAVRQAMRTELACALQTDWQWAWQAHTTHGPYSPNAQDSGRRALAGLAMHMLCLAAVRSGDAVLPGQVYQQFKDAPNMTERYNALSALVHSGHALAQEALDRFYAQFENEPLVLDKWFALQAMAPDQGGKVLTRVRQLMQHPKFSLRNPNRARSLILSLCSANPAAFHRADAAGYVYWREQVLALDAINPQVAARLARSMDRWARLDEPYRSAAREAIERVAQKPDLSSDVREVIGRALASPTPAPAPTCTPEATASASKTPTP